MGKKNLTGLMRSVIRIGIVHPVLEFVFVLTAFEKGKERIKPEEGVDTLIICRLLAGADQILLESKFSYTTLASNNFDDRSLYVVYFSRFVIRTKLTYFEIRLVDKNPKTRNGSEVRAGNKLEFKLQFGKDEK
mmetsp:Transcript_15718/g.23812  ORF Transcript_15718/g.23812 Transcript_15718/m.23812 type:complete len:133 (+) Transcript_15718:908-1306(+)